MSSFTPTLQALLIAQLVDIYHAENKLLNALPTMAIAASNPDLKAGFASHLAQTREHIQRLTQAMSHLGISPQGKTCRAMVGLIEESDEATSQKGPAAVRDAAIIGAAQRIEHYEIAAYGTARTFADILGEDRVADLLRTTLEEENIASQELAELADTVNADAFVSSANFQR